MFYDSSSTESFFTLASCQSWGKRGWKLYDNNSSKMKLFGIFKRKKAENVEPEAVDEIISIDSVEISSNFSGILTLVNAKPTVKIFPWKLYNVSKLN